MNKQREHLFVGDLHGDVEMFETALTHARSNDMILVCVGDYTDSLLYTVNDQKKLLSRMIEVYNKEDTVYLLGNHDLHYTVDPHTNRNHIPYKCSGYSRNKASKFYSLYMHMLARDKMLSFYYRVDDIITTHAGLSLRVLNSLFNRNESTFDYYTLDIIEDFFIRNEYELLTDLFRGVETNPIFDVGKLSGGYKSSGGIFWLRPGEFIMENQQSKFTQIVGHTAVNDTLTDYAKDPRWVSDCMLVIDAPGDVEYYNFISYSPKTKELTGLKFKRKSPALTLNQNS